jgi:hypothetical protein
MTPAEALEYIVEHFFHTDNANAAMHCNEVQYSPITFAAAEALRDLGESTYAMEKVLSHKGRYELDQGRI